MAMKILYIRRHRSINIINNSSGDGECVDAVMHSSLRGRIIAGKPHRMVVYVHKLAISSSYAPPTILSWNCYHRSICKRCIIKMDHHCPVSVMKVQSTLSLVWHTVVLTPTIIISTMLQINTVGEQLRWNWQSQGENRFTTSLWSRPPSIVVANFVFLCSTSSYSSSTHPSPAPTPSYFSFIVSATVLERRPPIIITMARVASIIPTTSSHSLDWPWRHYYLASLQYAWWQISGM